MRLVCLCGSTKHKASFFEAGECETLAGKVVLAPQVFSQADGITLTAAQIQMLVRIHYHKIELSDEVLINAVITAKMVIR